MGVRFECPAGHKLHVKAHLAGQRGICPECGARFIVPSFSGGRVAEASGAEAGSLSAGGGFVSVAVESNASFNAGLNAATGADIEDGDDSVAWYVRHAAGGQFGPVDSSVFGQWVDEGRVPADGWVWRTGWTDWKPGHEALKALVGGPSSTRAPATPPVPQRRAPTPSPAPRAAVRGAAAAPKPTPASASPFEADLGDVLTAPQNGRPVIETQSPIVGPRVAQLRRRKQLNQWLTVGLAVLAMILLAVLIYVMTRKPPAEEGPVSPTSGEPFANAPAKP